MKNKITKIKFTIIPPRCLNCRERSKETDIETFLQILGESIKNRTGLGIPVQITITKVRRDRVYKQVGSQKVNKLN